MSPFGAVAHLSFYPAICDFQSLGFCVSEKWEAWSDGSASPQPFELGVPYRVGLHDSFSGRVESGDASDSRIFTVALDLFEADRTTRVVSLWDSPGPEAPEPDMRWAVAAALLVAAARASSGRLQLS